MSEFSEFVSAIESDLAAGEQPGASADLAELAQLATALSEQLAMVVAELESALSDYGIDQTGAEVWAMLCAADRRVGETFSVIDNVARQMDRIGKLHNSIMSHIQAAAWLYTIDVPRVALGSDDFGEFDDEGIFR